MEKTWEKDYKPRKDNGDGILRKYKTQEQRRRRRTEQTPYKIQNKSHENKWKKL